MVVPCPSALHAGCHYLYDPIREIGNGTYILGIKIRDVSPVFVPINAQTISSAHVGHRYWDKHI